MTAKSAPRREEEKKRSVRAKVTMAGKGSTVMTETSELDSATYQPKTKESRAAFEAILAHVQASMGDIPRDVLRGAADEVLHLLKDATLRDPARQQEIDRLLGQKSTPSASTSS